MISKIIYIKENKILLTLMILILNFIIEIKIDRIGSIYPILYSIKNDI